MMRQLFQTIQLVVLRIFGLQWMSAPGISNGPRIPLSRRLRLESLELRRVMAATITTFEPTESGFVFELSEEVRTDELSLYDTESEAAGAADVTLTGSSVGNVQGTLMINGTTGTFVATGGTLTPDTYTVTLRSAADAFRDLADGELLDGENNASLPSGNGTPGGDFVRTFAVANSNASVVVSLPDFARGPTQTVQLPQVANATSGLPIRVSNAEGVTSVSLTLEYDSDLLDITGVELGDDAPQGSQVSFNLVSPGVVNIGFFALAPMSAGQADVIKLLATVPEDASYGDAHRLHFTSLSINSDAISAAADDAVHVVAFPGDANANRRYDAEDARLIARVGVDLDTGFVISEPTGQPTSADRLYPMVDPVIIGDVTGVDGLSPLDASDLLRRVVGLSTPNIPDLPDAQGPTAVDLSSTTIAEGSPVGTVVGNFSTSDPDSGDTHVYTLVSGTGDTDNASFTISGGSLRANTVFDQSVKDTFLIRIRSTDSTGRFLEKELTITITEANVAPTAIALSSSAVAENQTAGTLVGSLSTTDSNANDTHTYTLVSVDGNTNATTFSITGNTLRTGSVLDFESKTSYSVRIRSTDQDGLSVERTLTVTVTNANETPSSIEISTATIANNSVAGTVVGNLSTTDIDAGDTHTYQLVTGTGSTNNASFSIVGNQLRAAASISFSSQSSYSVRIRSTDADGLSVERVVVITETNNNVAPTAVELSNNSVAENAAAGTEVGDLSSVDNNSSDTHTYTLVTGTGSTDNASFIISGNKLVTSKTLDFEDQSSYSVRVRSTDNDGLTFDQVLTISATDVNEGSTNVTLSSNHIANGQASGTVVGLLGNDDPDAGDTFTYTLVSGTGSTDNGSFTIVGNELRTSFVANQSTKSSYSIRVRVVDGDGLASQETFTITVTNTNVAPTAMALSASAIAENVAVGSVVGQLSTTDANSDDAHTYTLVSGTGSTDNGSFTIVGNELRTNAELDFETRSSYSVRVRTTDSFGLTFDQTFTITVANVNDAPTAVALSNSSVAENAAVGTEVGELSTTDADSGATHTYTLVSSEGSTDNASFTISGDKLVTSEALDFEDQSSYSVRVRSTDNGGLTFEQVLTISATDVNEGSTNVTLSSNHVANGQASGTVVGLLGNDDPDAGDTFTYTLVSGTGSTDNGSFTIVGNELRTSFVANQSTKSSYSIRVRVVDGDGLASQETFTITVTNTNVAPTAMALSASAIAENVAVGSVVGQLSTTDANSDDAHTYTLVSGTGSTDNGSFTIVGNELRTNAELDFETRSSYSVRVRTTDSFGLTFDQTFTITVANINDAPTTVALSNSSVAENAAVGTEVGELSTTDADSGATHTYTLVSGEGSTDNASFTISGDKLVTSEALNFEAQSSYSVRVRSTDNGGLTFERTFTVAATNVNEAPTAVSISTPDVAEDEPVGTVVGQLDAEDPDSGDTFVYSLISGTGDTNNSSFTIQGGQLLSAENFDSAIKDMYSVRVRAVDAAGLMFDQVLIISVTDKNVAPTAVVLSSATVAVNEPIGTTVGLLTTTDANTTDVHVYSLVSGTGSADNALFTIEGNELKTNAAIGSGSASTLSIRVLSEDRFGLSFEQVLTITVTS